MYVEVRDGLADDVVDSHKRALSAEGRTNGYSDSLCHGQQRNHEIARQAQQRIDMASRSDEDMTGTLESFHVPDAMGWDLQIGNKIAPGR